MYSTVWDQSFLSFRAGLAMTTIPEDAASIREGAEVPVRAVLQHPGDQLPIIFDFRGNGLLKSGPINGQEAPWRPEWRADTERLREILLVDEGLSRTADIPVACDHFDALHAGLGLVPLSQQGTVEMRRFRRIIRGRHRTSVSYGRSLSLATQARRSAEAAAMPDRGA